MGAFLFGNADPVAHPYSRSSCKIISTFCLYTAIEMKPP